PAAMSSSDGGSGKPTRTKCNGRSSAEVPISEYDILSDCAATSSRKANSSACVVHPSPFRSSKPVVTFFPAEIIPLLLLSAATAVKEPAIKSNDKNKTKVNLVLIPLNNIMFSP